MTADGLLLDLYGALALQLIPVRAKRPQAGDDWNRIPEQRRAERITPDHVAEELGKWLQESQRNQIGMVIPRGVVALDADTSGSAARLQELSPLGCPIQETAKGCHLLFRVPTDAEIIG